MRNFERALCPHRNGRARASHCRKRRGRSRPLPDQEGRRLLWPVTGRRAQDPYHRGVPFSEVKTILAAMLADGDLIEVKVEGWKAVHHAGSSDAALLDDLIAGRVPGAMDAASRGPRRMRLSSSRRWIRSCPRRAKILFGFDYVWEVYKPVHQRKFGYYTLPVLWGERLVARFDSKPDRTTNTFIILGLWLEDETLGTDEAFCGGAGPRFCALRPVSRRGRAGCQGDQRAAAASPDRVFHSNRLKSRFAAPCAHVCRGESIHMTQPSDEARSADNCGRRAAPAWALALSRSCSGSSHGQHCAWTCHRYNSWRHRCRNRPAAYGKEFLGGNCAGVETVADREIRTGEPRWTGNGEQKR